VALRCPEELTTDLTTKANAKENNIDNVSNIPKNVTHGNWL